MLEYFLEYYLEYKDTCPHIKTLLDNKLLKRYKNITDVDFKKPYILDGKLCLDDTPINYCPVCGKYIEYDVFETDRILKLEK